ncbi:hypothetical protein H2198_009006 [Neophaeococcomyces mojaviensis]|uniref:Uncharacterized protein n=1 Tax=Neophaeococcomyces mojaviensis TaxID=3383035 RepID=A0ACC2ZVX3_9EURO|nr:hypothetical protein H2198_009006 [Knufia sp. JES_112]
MTALTLVNQDLNSVFWQTAGLLVAVLSVSLLYRAVRQINYTYRVRQRFQDIPCLPRHWLWGHLVNVGQKLSPGINRHPDYGFEEVWNELGQPPAYLVDLATIDRPMLIIMHPSIAEGITQATTDWKYSTPKSDTVRSLTPLVGKHSLVVLDGEEWKTIRKRFNKGFAPTHLNTLTGLIVSKTKIFLDRLKKNAQDGEVFMLKEPASDLTTDVITQVTIEKDFQAQTVPEGQGPKSTFGILTAIRTMSGLVERTGQGFDFWNYINLARFFKSWLYERLYDRAILNEIVSKLPNSKASSDTKPSQDAKAIVHLSLAGLKPTPQVLASTVSSVKTFLFAGQDTTSTLIQWMAYELSKSYPSSPLYSEHYRKVREQLCAEHDFVFGSANPLDVLNKMSSEEFNMDEVLAAKLPYTTAFVKETLRLHPPAGTARLTPMAHDSVANGLAKPMFLDFPAWTHSKTGEHHDAKKVRVDGLRFYNCHYLLQRNPNVWGPDAAIFDPSRFLEQHGHGIGRDEREDETVHVQSNGHTGNQYPQKRDAKELPHPYHISLLPQGSFRVFERGPRTCIGTNLAYMEAKIVLCAIARAFVWVKDGPEGTMTGHNLSWEKRTSRDQEQHWWEKEVWNINNVTSVPCDGMKMKIKLRGS